MSTFRLIIITPKRQYLDTEVELLEVRGSEGYMTILPNHAPLVSMVEVGSGYTKIKGKTTKYAISNGVINVTKESTILLVNSIENKDEIDIERAKLALDRAKKRIQDKNGDLKRAKLALERALTRIDVAGGN